MTKEEAIKYLLQIYPNGGHCWLDSQRIEAIEMAIMALSQPSLPSNLDEAANDYCSAYYDWDDEGERKEVVRTFKAGAEWMAGQGLTKDGLVSVYDNGRLRVYTTILDKEDGIKFGDKVVVQIRKK